MWITKEVKDSHNETVQSLEGLGMTLDEMISQAHELVGLIL